MGCHPHGAASAMGTPQWVTAGSWGRGAGEDAVYCALLGSRLREGGTCAVSPRGHLGPPSPVWPSWDWETGDSSHLLTPGLPRAWLQATVHQGLPRGRRPVREEEGQGQGPGTSARNPDTVSFRGSPGGWGLQGPDGIQRGGLGTQGRRSWGAYAVQSRGDWGAISLETPETHRPL